MPFSWNSKSDIGGTVDAGSYGMLERFSLVKTPENCFPRSSALAVSDSAVSVGVRRVGMEEDSVRLPFMYLQKGLGLSLTLSIMSGMKWFWALRMLRFSCLLRVSNLCLWC